VNPILPVRLHSDLIISAAPRAGVFRSPDPISDLNSGEDWRLVPPEDDRLVRTVDRSQRSFKNMRFCCGLDLERLPTAILIVVVGVVAALRVWYLAIRLSQPASR
jgi:hypothetical protein